MSPEGIKEVKPTSKFTSTFVRQRVIETLIEVLVVDDDEVVPEADITADLGAGSIEFLDLVFRLEQNFRTRLGYGKIFSNIDGVGLVMGEDFEGPHGRLTGSGIIKLQAIMPELDLSEII